LVDRETRISQITCRCCGSSNRCRRRVVKVTSLSVHDSFGTKGWTLSVHDDCGTYEIHFGTCAFCCTTSVHAKYHFGTSLCRYRYIARERQFFYADGRKKCPVDVSLFLVCVAMPLVCSKRCCSCMTSVTNHRRPFRERINFNEHVTFDVQVYVLIDSLSTADMSRQLWGFVCQVLRELGSQSNTIWPGPRTTSVLNDILIHPVL